jgi:hypothetical protein
VLVLQSGCFAKRTSPPVPNRLPFVADAITAAREGLADNFTLKGRIRGVVETDGRWLKVVVLGLEVLPPSAGWDAHADLQLSVALDVDTVGVRRVLVGGMSRPRYVLALLRRAPVVASGSDSVAKVVEPLEFELGVPPGVALKDLVLSFQFAWVSNDYGRVHQAFTYARTGHIFAAGK